MGRLDTCRLLMGMLLMRRLLICVLLTGGLFTLRLLGMLLMGRLFSWVLLMGGLFT